MLLDFVANGPRAGWGGCANKGELRKGSINIMGALARIFAQDRLASCPMGSGDNGREAAHLASSLRVSGRNEFDADDHGSHGFFRTV